MKEETKQRRIKELISRECEKYNCNHRSKVYVLSHAKSDNRVDKLVRRLKNLVGGTKLERYYFVQEAILMYVELKDIDCDIALERAKRRVADLIAEREKMIAQGITLSPLGASFDNHSNKSRKRRKSVDIDPDYVYQLIKDKKGMTTKQLIDYVEEQIEGARRYKVEKVVRQVIKEHNIQTVSRRGAKRKEATDIDLDAICKEIGNMKGTVDMFAEHIVNKFPQIKHYKAREIVRQLVKQQKIDSSNIIRKKTKSPQIAEMNKWLKQEIEKASDPLNKEFKKNLFERAVAKFNDVNPSTVRTYMYNTIRELAK